MKQEEAKATRRGLFKEKKGPKMGERREGGIQSKMSKAKGGH